MKPAKLLYRYLMILLLFAVVYPLAADNTKISWLHDSGNTHTIESVQNAEFTHLETISLNQGFSRGALWLRIEGHFPDGNMGLLLQENYLDFVDFYFVKDGKWQTMQAGYLRPLSVRPLQMRSLAFPLPASNNQQVFYLTKHGKDPLNLHGEILPLEQILRQDNLVTLYYGIFLGAIAIMVLYNLALFISLRDPSFLYFSIYKLFFLAAHIYVSGLHNLYLWPQSPGINKYILNVSYGLLPFFLTLYLYSILRIRGGNVMLQKIMKAILLTMAIAAVSIFATKYERQMEYISYLNTVFIIIILPLVIYRSFRGDIIARYFTMIFSFNVLIGFISVLGSVGAINASFPVLHASDFSGLMETFLLSFLTGYRYNLIRKKNSILEKDYNDLLLRLECRQKSTRIANLDIENITSRIKQETLENPVFFQQDFSLQKFSVVLGIRPDQLSEIMNSELRMSFTDLLKTIRIHKSCELLKNDPEKKILEVAFESGFKSKSTFNQSFYEVMKMTPTEFREIQ